MKKDILEKKIKILKQRSKHFMCGAGLAGLSLSVPLALGCQNSLKQADKAETPKDTMGTIKPVEIKHPVATIAYYTDTLYHATSSLLFFNRDKITRYYVENNNSFRILISNFVHEDWHRHNTKSGFRANSKLSPYEYYRLAIQDEITANLAAILAARYEYLAAKNKKQFIEKYEKSYMGFYFKGIKEGKFVPNAYGIDIQERIFLANGVKKMWLEMYYNTYAPALYRMLPRYVDRRGLFSNNPKAYQKYVSYFWTIGGIDFSKYLKGDIDQKSDERVMLIDALKDVNCLKKDASFLINNIMANMPKLKNFAPQDQSAALLNLVISSKIKSVLKTKDRSFLANNSEAVTAAYNKVMFEVARDSSFYQFFDKRGVMDNERFSLLTKTDNFENNIRSFYVYQEVDLSKRIKNFNIIKTIKPQYLPDDLFMKLYFNTEPKNPTENIIVFPLAHIEQNTFIRSPKPKDVQKPKRISEKQFIDIPNLWEPILTNATPQDTQEILSMIDRFNNIPAVLKSCNTSEIEKYKQEHEVLEHIFAKKNLAIR